jgi:hypothetical protein
MRQSGTVVGGQSNLVWKACEKYQHLGEAREGDNLKKFYNCLSQMGYEVVMQARQMQAVLMEELVSLHSWQWAADCPEAHAVLSPLCLKRNKL